MRPCQLPSIHCVPNIAAMFLCALQLVPGVVGLELTRCRDELAQLTHMMSCIEYVSVRRYTKHTLTSCSSLAAVRTIG
jgi:hypothetical protein